MRAIHRSIAIPLNWVPAICSNGSTQKQRQTKLRKWSKTKCPQEELDPDIFLPKRSINKAVYRLACSPLQLVPPWQTGIPPNQIKDVMVLCRDRSRKSAAEPRGYFGTRVNRTPSSATIPRLSPSLRTSIPYQPTPPNTKNWWKHCDVIATTQKCQSFWRKFMGIIILPTITQKDMRTNRSNKRRSAATCCEAGVGRKYGKSNVCSQKRSPTCIQSPRLI